MYTLVYTSEAGSIEFSASSGFVIEKFDSPYALSVEFTTSTGSKNYGVKVEGQRVQPKTITITGTIIGDARQKKKDLVHVLAPMQEGTLNFDGKYSLKVFPKQSPVVEAKNLNPRFSFMLYVPSPYWQSVAETSVDIVDGAANVTNNGDAPCTWALDILATGEVVNPMLIKTETEEFVRVNMTLTEGQRLKVSTDQDEMLVTLVDVDGKETDAFSFLDVDSTSFPLDVGENELSFNPVENVQASISYFESYAGV